MDWDESKSKRREMTRMTVNGEAWNRSLFGSIWRHTFSATGSPPGLSVRYQNLFPLFDLCAAPDTHPHRARVSFGIRKDSVGSGADSAVVVDKSSFVTHCTSIYANAGVIQEATEGKIIVRRRTIVAVNFT